MKLELEIKHFTAYTPYKLKCRFMHPKEEFQHDGILTGIHYNINDTHPIRIRLDYHDAEHIWMFKPILRPLSDLDWKFCRDYDLQREKVKGYLEFGRITLKQYTYLLENHYDVFDLIPQGLAISIHEV